MRFIGMLAVGVAKISVLCANIVFMVSGITVIVLGNLMLNDLDEYAAMFDGVFSAMPIAVISIGAIALAIGFCGFFGVLVENRCMVILYSALLVVVLLGKLAVGIAALVEYQQVAGDLQAKLYVYFAEEYPGGADLSSPSFDKIQNSFECCGVVSRFDYVPNYVDALPMSCCIGAPATCTQTSVLVKPDGCAEEMTTWVANWFQLIGIVALAVILVEIVLLILSSCLANHWKKKKGVQTV